MSKLLGIETIKVKPKSDFEKKLETDSLDVFEFIRAIENEFEMEMEDPVASPLIRIQDMLNYIEGNLNKD